VTTVTAAATHSATASTGSASSRVGMTAVARANACTEVLYLAGRRAGVDTPSPARRSAKYKTSVQALALAMAVMPTLEDADLVLAVALWVAVAFTVVTGVQYMLDSRSARARPRSRNQA